MLPDLSNILAWKPRPRRSGADKPAAAAASANGKRGSTGAERAMTATSQQDADDASETESAASSQSGGYLFRRQQSTQRTDDEDESDDNNDDVAKPMGGKQQQKQKQQAAPSLRAVYSLARASKMLLSKTRGAHATAAAAYYQQQQQRASGAAHAPAARRKPHSRSVDELSESDFLPLATGTRVSTPFGLGSVVEVRARDGVTVVRLQRSHPNAVAAPATLFLRGDDDDCHAVPALVDDPVVTPAGNARVLSYDPHRQLYLVCMEHSGGSDAEHTCQVRASDVRRRNATSGAAGRPARRMRFHSMESHEPASTRSARNSSSSGAAPPALARGLSTALRSVVATSSSVSASTMHFLSNKYFQGQPVITKFGAGVIVAVQAGDECAGGSHPAAGRILQVELEWGAMAFLHADAITSYPKALVGMDVSTKFGPGVVVELRASDGIYTVRLHEEQPVGASDTVYVPESDLHRVGKLAATVGSVHKQMRGKLSALAQRLGHERVVVMHLRDDEISSAGI